MATITMQQTRLQSASKGKTIQQIVDDLKDEASRWGGETVQEKEYMVGGKVKEIVLTVKFKVH